MRFFRALGTSTSTMLPAVAISMVAGPQAGVAAMGLSSAGNAYKQKLDEGWTKEQAGTYATLIGVSEATLQNLIGGIDALGGEKLLTGKALDGLVTATSQIDNAFARFAVDFGGRLAIKGMPEAFENGAQAILASVFEHIVTGEALDIDWNDVAYEALMGFATSVILNAPQEHANTQSDTALANANEVGYNQTTAQQSDFETDRALFESYQDVLGENAPATFEEFEALKNSNPEAFADLTDFYDYKCLVPEASKQDFAYCKAVQATGVFGDVRVPPEKIDTTALTFDATHSAKRHTATFEDAKSFIENALFTIKRTHQSGEVYTNYYSRFGAAYVRADGRIIKTAFKHEDFYNTIQKAVDVFG